jgi:hypothetical protein
LRGDRRQEIRDVRVKLCEALVEGREPTTLRSSELGKAGIGHLSMADDPVQRYIAVSERVRPELVAIAVLHRVQDCSGMVGGLSFADQQPQQASLHVVM